MRHKYMLRGTYIAVLFLIFFSFNTYAQVGIGTTNPNSNAKLDITSTPAEPGGLLLPRVALTSKTSFLPLAAHVAGMTVYNTITAGSGATQVTPGYYYNDGSGWVRVGGGGTGTNENWLLKGNAGTTPGTGAGQDYLGTADEKMLIVATNSTERMRVLADGKIAVNRRESWQDPYPADEFVVYGNPNGTAIRGQARSGTSSIGVWGENEQGGRGVNGTSTMGGTGVFGSNNATGLGVNGFIFGGGPGHGVEGQVQGTGDGVRGIATSGTGVYGSATLTNAQGGFFVNAHPNGFGLVALAGGNTYSTFTNSGTGAAITGRAFGTTSIATGNNGVGILAIGDDRGTYANSPLGAGVIGYGYQAGVFGESGYFAEIGVHGRGEGVRQGGNTYNGTGVYGENISYGYGVSGESDDIGVIGRSNSSTIADARGGNFLNTRPNGFGLWALGGGGAYKRFIESGTGAAITGRVYGTTSFATSVNGTGLVGVGNNRTTASLAENGSGVSGTGLRTGVYGKADQPTNGIGVIGVGNNLTTYTIPDNGAGVAGTGINIGVYGHATDVDGYGVYSSGNFLADGDIHATGDITADGTITAPRGINTDGFATADGNMAIDGIFTAQMVLATGDLTAGGTKNFIIDDPRDPANKFLKHASIESNEILNLYRGVNTFDASGEAIVQLPDYYDAINKNASYQLTPIGAAMPNLYIATKVNNGVFVIAGGVAGKEVSWTLTAERNDPYIRNNPEIRNMVVDKGPDRGRYLAPEAYGQSANQGILNNRVSEMRSASISVNPQKAMAAQEMQSQTAEATKVDSEQAKSSTTSSKIPRTESSEAIELREVPLEKVKKIEVSPKIMAQEGQSTSEKQVQSSGTLLQTSEEGTTAPTTISEKEDK